MIRVIRTLSPATLAAWPRARMIIAAFSISAGVSASDSYGKGVLLFDRRASKDLHQSENLSRQRAA